MASNQSVDIFSMLNKAQTEYQEQQHNSVAAFFRQASNGAANHNNNHAPNRSMPMPIKNLNSLEQIERQIRSSPPSNYESQNNNNILQPTQTNTANMANSPLAQFFNSNNFNNAGPQRPAARPEAKSPKDNSAQKISAPPGFSNNKAPQHKNLLANNNNNIIKETKLITPTMFAPPSSNEKKPSVAEPLTKNQLLQALNYLIENDEDFTKKIHEAYINSFKSALP